MATSGNPAYSPVALLDENQWQQLNTAASGLDASQLLWASGYLAGLAQAGQVSAAPQPQGAAVADKSVTILYGSQTGNAKGVAEQYHNKLKADGLSAKLLNMADYKPKNIKNESHVVIVVSTHGEGDAPDDAVQLHEFLGGKKAPKLDGLKYTVLGLGDSSYEFFCQTAKDFDERLAKLGATALLPRVDCDVDFESDVDVWSNQVKAKLQEDFKSAAVVPMPGLQLAAGNNTQDAAQQYSKKNPFPAELVESLKITGRDSVKDIRHIEISLEDSGIQYEPGDALGVWFLNDAALVADILNTLNIDADTEVSIKDETLTVQSALQEKLELTQSYPGFVQKYAEFSGDQKVAELLADKAQLREYLADRQIVDIVKEFPSAITAQQLVDALRPLMPRLYSIASSQAEVEDEVHLTVALVEYDKFGFTHQGGASGYLGTRLEEGQQVKVYVEKNANFRLPTDPNTPVIMVGPGTGIAPFRAFMQEREAQEAEGKNWLFFGNPHFTQDFLYQVEWQRFLSEGTLDKISLAFSRDQAEKVYVQHRLLENGKEVWQWLEEGAHFYVCGDATHMAKDVNDALLSIIAEHGGKSAEDAEQYLNDLRRAKRYQKDVY
ncbi:assimilatory sulfite reductase (NADPH) flavoprotein subunit [Planctobacterium marinum]|uniref:assimilatory sulfite reductase (NADPH) flavoprotein subunit n=1 Tax=Planctobacterium marinum TaxID=1631968 RepID=UPI001E471480|nr:assimilatory sulfite reductase (NADPH) flavoprotein subunit [Planctobacterium marinum]MCC2607893.1 assimilatory sulfite reductase (NADPH) flavoprotein subunit [Planctobacterium marinum]